MTKAPLRILLLEDDLSLGQLTAETIDRAGNYMTEHAATTEAALDALNHESFDLCVLDLNLQNGNCSTVISEANRRDLPVILTSGNDDFEMLTVAPTRSLFLQKPVQFEKWLTAIRDLTREPAPE